MKFLQKFEFSEDQLQYLDDNAAAKILEALETNKKLVSANMKYLMDLGVKNYREIFLEYYDLFLLDNSNFMEIFNKYDREDLVDKLEKNPTIIEYL